MADDEMLTMDDTGARTVGPSPGTGARPPGHGDADASSTGPAGPAGSDHTGSVQAGCPPDGPDPDPDRAARFREDVAELAGTSPSARREGFLIRLGVVLLVVGPVWVAVEYLVSHASTSSLEQRDAIIGALFGGTITVVGAVLFLRYTGARFLRFWLARLSFEQHHHTEELLDALRDR